jgi:glycosyltransferase involved in cell wall biosynthesis
MALGLAVVSTDCPCGGPAMLIENGVNGMLVPVGNAYALADAFRRILSDGEFEKKLGDNAYDITRKLNPEKVNREWYEYLKKMMGDLK